MHKSFSQSKRRDLRRGTEKNTVGPEVMHRQEPGYQNAELHGIDAVVEGEHEGAFCLLALVATSLHEHLAQALPVQIESHLCHCLVGFSHLLEPTQSRTLTVTTIAITMGNNNNDDNNNNNNSNDCSN